MAAVTKGTSRSAVFDLAASDSVRAGFRVCRLPAKPPADGLGLAARRLFAGISAARAKGRWVIVAPTAENRQLVATYEADAAKLLPASYSVISEMLADGKLRGCELQQQSDGGVGLFATRRLPQYAPVAVETGLVWSAAAHDAVVESSGDPMMGLSANFVDPENLRPLVSAEEWGRYVSASSADQWGGVEGVVVESSSQASRAHAPALSSLTIDFVLSGHVQPA